MPSLHEKADALSHAAPENRSSANHSGLPLPEDSHGKKVSRKKKACSPREDDSSLSIKNLDYEQDDNHHVNQPGQDQFTAIGENSHCYDTFSTTDFSR